MIKTEPISARAPKIVPSRKLTEDALKLKWPWIKRAAEAAFVAVGLASAAPGLAADLPTKKPPPAPAPAPVIPSTWRFELTGYGWASSLSGNAGIRNFPTLPFYADFQKIIEHLGGVFMGAATASNGTYIVGVDFIWSRLVGSSTFNNPNSTLYGTQANITLNEAVATGLGGIRIPIGPPNLELYAIGGVRWFGTSDSLTLTHPVFGYENHASLRKDWIDPVVGVTGRYRIDPKWFVNTEADIGGWSNTSATGQALTAVGYNWTANISTTLGYRVLYTYDRQDTGDTRITGANGSFRYQQWMYGPYVSFKYGF
jgi:hypothetical protein